MFDSRIGRRIPALVLVALLAVTSGCDVSSFAGLLVSPLTFGLGFLTASQMQTTTVERHCFVNGVEVDCAELSVPVD